MQAPKTRSGSYDLPRKSSPVTPRSTRQCKMTGPESDSAMSRRSVSRTPTEHSPRVIDRRSPKSPASEKKRYSKVSQLEFELMKAQEDLKKTKELLSSSESCKKQALEESDAAKKQYSAIVASLEDAKHQLRELSSPKDAKVQEFLKPSQGRDQACQSELEAPQKQNSTDAVALVSAMNEIQKLKSQIDMVVESETAQAKQAKIAHAELEILKEDMVETITLVGTLKTELSGYENSEAEHEQLLTEAQVQLEVTTATIEALKADGLMVMGSIKSFYAELEASKNLVNILQSDAKAMHLEVEHLRSLLKEAEIRLKVEQVRSAKQIHSAEDMAVTLQSELDQLRYALEAAEKRLPVERNKNSVEVQSACESAEHSTTKSDLTQSEQEPALKEDNESTEELRALLIQKETELQKSLDLNEKMKEEMEKRLAETELESKLLLSLAEVEELKSNIIAKDIELTANLSEMEAELARISSLNGKLEEEVQSLSGNAAETELESKLQLLMEEVAELKANLLDKETELQGISEENVVPKEIQKQEIVHQSSESATAELEAVRASEQAAIMKLGLATEEADKNRRKASKIAEQLDAARVTNSEMEAELRRLRIQSEQWRKAAEAAASILATGNNGKMMERSGSMDSDYDQFGGNLLSSPYSDDMDDITPKKKKNALKKLGVFWKRGQK